MLEEIFMSNQKDYFGLDDLVSLILAIIPFTSWVCGAITRFKEGKIVATIIRLFFGFNVIWVADLVCMILNKSILRVLDM